MSPRDLPQPVLPLVARVTAIAGESLLSLAARACEANVIERPGELFSLLGKGGRPAFAAFTVGEHAPVLAKLLGVDDHEITERLHGRKADFVDPTFVHWFGTTLERRFLKAEPRRFAAAALRISNHHRAVWSVSALSFCPETFQELLSTCHECGRALGWAKTQGLIRCEHCRASLLEVDAPFVPDELRPKLKAVTDLISTDVAVRSAAAMRFPPPFCSWPPGEIFGAIVEFGVAWEHPTADRSSSIGRALIWGHPEVASTAALVSGHRLVTGWPGSLSELVARTYGALEHSATASKPLALKDLGLLVRHLDQRLPKTRLRSLLRHALPRALVDADAPVKLLSNGSGQSKKQDHLLTMAEAKARFGLSDPVLRRLCPEGECFRGGRGGRGGAWRFDSGRLAMAAAAYHDAVGTAGAAARLGAPAYTMSAFVRLSALEYVQDSDALRMLHGRQSITRSSLDDFTRRLGTATERPIPGFVYPQDRAQSYLERALSYRPGDSDPFSFDITRSMIELALSVRVPALMGESLAWLLVGEFSPNAWARAFQGVARGRVVLRRRYEGDQPIASRLLVDAKSLRSWLARAPSTGRNVSAWVTGGEAALMLGVDLSMVGELIEAGHIPARKDAEEWRISVRQLRAFHAEYMPSAEYFQRAGSRQRPIFDLPDPAFSTRHGRVWRRAEIVPLIDRN